MLQTLVYANLENLNDEVRKNSRRGQSREIRAGRRHVDNKPGYSIITSANEKVSRFLQDPSQSELKLHPMHHPEREKLHRLANLYSLSLKGDLNCPVLYKTHQTTQAVCVDHVSLSRYADYKRLRKTPPNSPISDEQGQQVVASLPRVPECFWDLPNQTESHVRQKLHSFGQSKSS